MNIQFVNPEDNWTHIYLKDENIYLPDGLVITQNSKVITRTPVYETITYEKERKEAEAWLAQMPEMLKNHIELDLDEIFAPHPSIKTHICQEYPLLACLFVRILPD